jgi:hypothetical protein
MTENPDFALIEFINTYFDESLTDPYPGGNRGLVNPAWYEKSRQMQRQIYLSTNDYVNATSHIQSEMDVQQSPVHSETIRYIYLAAPTKEQRDIMAEEMRRVFTGSQNTAIVDYLASDDTMVRLFKMTLEHKMDKDAKYDIFAWLAIFEIRIYW